MMMTSPHVRRLLATGFLFAAIGMLACEGDPPTSRNLQIQAAKGTGGKPIKVTGITPPSGDRGTQLLSVIVEGSGFDPESKVQFHPPGGADDDIVDSHLRVTNTEWLSNTAIRFDLEILETADVGLRDVSVSFRGRRGVGTEKFDVTCPGGADCPGGSGSIGNERHSIEYTVAAGGAVSSDGSTLTGALWDKNDGNPDVFNSIVDGGRLTLTIARVVSDYVCKRLDFHVTEPVNQDFYNMGTVSPNNTAVSGGRVECQDGARFQNGAWIAEYGPCILIEHTGQD